MTPFYKIRLLLYLLTPLFLFIAMGLVVVSFAIHEFKSKGPLEETRTLIIPHGTSTVEIARLLEKEGIIKHASIFLAAAKTLYKSTHLRAGEYEFAAHISPKEIMEMCIEGKTVKRKFTVPEGLTTYEIIKLIIKEETLHGEVEEWPETTPYGEGELLPETYIYSYGDGKMPFLKRLRKAQEELITELWADRASGLPFKTPEEAVILASIVEKETGKKDERGRVASVFINRLRKGMKLQADPTVIYSITMGKKELERSLTKRDLANTSPYNTYVHTGLPPGPITNPGKAALSATLKPPKTDDIFFVSDTEGGHFFASNLAEHNRNVEKYRSLLVKE